MSEEKQEWLRSAGVDVEAAQGAAARARDLALASSAAKRELKFIAYVPDMNLNPRRRGKPLGRFQTELGAAIAVANVLGNGEFRF